VAESSELESHSDGDDSFLPEDEDTLKGDDDDNISPAVRALMAK
jgi:hypothetical protein